MESEYTVTSTGDVLKNGEYVGQVDYNNVAINSTPHYYDKGIEPVEYINANNLDFFEGNVIKYITRHKEKGGAKDIKKAIKYCEMILKYQYEEGE